MNGLYFLLVFFAGAGFIGFIHAIAEQIRKHLFFKNSGLDAICIEAHHVAIPIDIDQVKDLQRMLESNEGTKVSWSSYCDSCGRTVHVSFYKKGIIICGPMDLEDRKLSQSESFFHNE